MAHRLLTTLGVAWLGVSLAACGATEQSGGEESLALGQKKSGEDIQAALNALGGAEVLGVHADGIPDTLRGELGRVERTLSVGQGAESALSAVAPVFRLRAQDLVFQKAHTDAQGNQHLRYRQMKNGLEVVGGDLILHVRPDGTVFLANGSARDGVDVSSQPRVGAPAASAAALRTTRGTDLSIQGEPRRVYVRTGDGRLSLAWEVRVVGEGEGMPLRDRVYVSATDSSVLLRVPELHTLLYRSVYSANYGTTTPGVLKRCDVCAPIGDDIVDMNWNLLTYAYNCYQANFLRDSYDNAGGRLISTVHYSRNYANAYWDGTQLVYGDGDGVNASPLGMDGDATVHELTHGMTESESNLIYAGEPGALNEALSDTFSAICESWQSGTWSTSADIWKIGEDMWTPPIAGDALRYMDDPKKDGASIDYAADYTSSQDVHYTSGVPNLAFALLAKGGTHPRGRSTIVVPAIGVQRAAQIWYRASTDIYVPSTTFAQARLATAIVASQLGYDQTTVDAVNAAWEAVGVGVTQPSPTPIALSNGVGVSVADSKGNKKYYSLDVPAGQTSLTFTLSGGTGDADLYVRFGAVPETSKYDCRPYLSGNNETCTITNIQAGRYYVMVHAYADYSGVTLTGTSSPSGG
ncbi:M4 family metallopeptidase [Vitiosangium sp. GDMCC 1.1324]|uniref:M4 family metallopeptidase n=1 Tax=Vitiosangium sp. (strain GDMCC 1.1324) TaxID=2138576 RepID=UPI000D350CF5|nr:M4 family metallopeptidase [Vitiosangium sp. GDMCC 1.1324]PTL76501.1 peptidase M4 [Vitiosangium sp. GDMCC 1.1324]